MPTCWIIAGPNGAGKTTFAVEYLPIVAGCSRFINADAIAAKLLPQAPALRARAAGRQFLRVIAEHIAQGEDFAFETTLAGRGHLQLVADLRAVGWRVELIYLALPNRAMSRMRVAERVSHGGHDIPVADIERRFSRSLGNLLNWFGSAVDACHCMMNSGPFPEPIFEQRGTQRLVLHEERYELLFGQAIS
ncbi:hypothetical protein GJ699_07640 [Duganella sp. FT80W]|uniref:UDP-N-acetylglucosamine kinase n=1 Tax=Duganella guangzhouensis TaxID=2666084 RepID=A0A6I2KWC2_9BURK|nr:AAA family ATPase [Duganella guangzhouensis]MRW89852.1 hypothetical protein [Duganella guangzhouensis]